MCRESSSCDILIYLYNACGSGKKVCAFFVWVLNLYNRCCLFHAVVIAARYYGHFAITRESRTLPRVVALVSRPSCQVTVPLKTVFYVFLYSEITFLIFEIIASWPIIIVSSLRTVCVCVCVCVYVCMHVYVYVYVRTYVRTYLRTYICVCLYVCVCMYVCMYICMYVCVYVCIYKTMLYLTFLLHSH